MSEHQRLLVVEDDEAIAQGLVFNLSRVGYDAALATTGKAALDRALAEPFDLLLLDVRLPEIDGFEVCRQLRAAGRFMPILMLTARTQPQDVVEGLHAGADDYLTKPFDLDELLARVASLLRRQSWAQTHSGPGGANETPEPPDLFAFGEYWVDFRSFQALTRQGLRELPAKEIAVLRVFAGKPNQVVTRRELLAAVWGLPDHPNERVVDNVILSLRRAFEESAWRPAHLHSVRGVGYRFTT